MPFIHPKGSPSSRIWVISEAPLSSDIAKGFLFSGGLGYVWDKMIQDACIKDYYVTCRRPNTDDVHAFNIIEGELNHYKPPFIITLGSAGEALCEILHAQDKKKTKTSQVVKYTGSLITSDLLSYPHYIMPLPEIQKINMDWKERNIVTYFDLQKLREEYYYYAKHGTIQPLPQRDLRFQEMSLDEILTFFTRFYRASLLSVDIESVYTKRDSLFSPHPGYPTTISIADSQDFAISFNFFRDSIVETCILWRELDKLLKSKRILGQNFFEFDAPRLRSLGFDVSKTNIIDTKLRHHILWPELSHTLQFMTRQYTREPYYKDEGKQWNGKNMTKLRRYNCLDTCVTYEVYLQQEDEFRERKQIA